MAMTSLPLYPVLQLERVNKQLYRPFAFKELSLDNTVDINNVDHTHSPKEPTHVPLTSPAQLTPPTSSLSDSSDIPQRRRKVPKRMADGEIFMKPRKRTKDEIMSLSLNRNYNNNIVESCDYHVTVASQVSSDPVAPPTHPIEPKESVTPAADIPPESVTPATDNLPIKRTRGRPKKESVTPAADIPPECVTPAVDNLPIKRTRRRPKKESVTPAADNLPIKRTRGRPKKMIKTNIINNESSLCAVKQVIQAFENDQTLPSNSTSSIIDETTNTPSLSSGDHIYLPVFSDPTPPPACHTPIIITNEPGVDYSNSSQENIIQIQENVDNLLSEDTVRLLETVLGNMEVGVVNGGMIPKNNKACPLGAEFQLETEELLGPWSEVLSDVNKDLCLSVQDDQINGLLTDLISDPAHSCYGHAPSINDHQDKQVTMTTIVSSSAQVFPYSKDVINLNLNDCVDEGAASWFMEAESELMDTRENAIGGGEAVSVATATNGHTSSLNGYVLGSSLAISETIPLAINQNEPTSGDYANEPNNNPVAMVTSLPDKPVSMTTSSIVAAETRLTTNGMPPDKRDAVDHTHLNKPITKRPKCVKRAITKKGSIPSGITKKGSIPTDIKKKGSIPSGIAKKGSIPTDIKKKGSIPSGITKKGSIPTDIKKKGSIPSGITKKGSIPTDIKKKGSIPSGITKKGSIPTGIAKKGSIPTDIKKKGSISSDIKKKGSTRVVKRKKESAILKCTPGSVTPTCAVSAIPTSIVSATPTKVSATPINGSPPIIANCQLSARKGKTPTKSPTKTAPFSLDDSYSEDGNLIIDVEGVACNGTGDVPQVSSPVKRVSDSSNDVISNDRFTFNLNKLAMSSNGPVANGNQTTPTTVLPSVYSKLDPSHRIRVPLFKKPLQMFTPTPPADHTFDMPLSDHAHTLAPNGFSFGNVDLPVSSLPSTPIRAVSPVQTPPTSPVHASNTSSSMSLNTPPDEVKTTPTCEVKTTPTGEVMIDGADKISLFVDETIDDMEDSKNSNATKNSNNANSSNVTKNSNVANKVTKNISFTKNCSIAKNSSATNVTNNSNTLSSSNTSIASDKSSFRQVQKWVVAQQRDPPPPPTTPPTHFLSPPVPPLLPCQPIGCGIWTTPQFVPPTTPLSRGCPPIPTSFFVPPLTSRSPITTPPPPPPIRPNSVSKWSDAKPVNSSFNPSLPPNTSSTTHSNELDLLNYPPPLNPKSVIELGLIDPSLLNLPIRIASSSLRKYLAEPSNRLAISSSQYNNILTLLKDLLRNDYSRASTGFMSLCVDSGIPFSARVLTSLLFLCTRQTRVICPIPILIAGRVYSELRRIYDGRVSYVHHIHYLRTLASYNEINPLFAVYLTAEKVGVVITPTHLDLMLGKAELLGNRMIKVLNDAKTCVTPDALVRFSERVFDQVSIPALTSKPDQALISWIRANPGTTRLLPIHQIKCFLRGFIEGSKWDAAVSLCECCSKMIPRLGNSVLTLIDTFSKAPPTSNETKYIMNFITELSNDQIRRLDSQVWCRLLKFSINLKLVAKSCWLYRAAISVNQSMEAEVMLNLLSILIEQESGDIPDILTTFLSRPHIEVAHLTRLCELCEQAELIQHLYTICHTMLDQKIPPPLHSLKCLIQHHTKEKAYEQLAYLVKQAFEKKVMLAYEFYEMVLIELRSWGGDLHALDIVYQFIGRRASNHGDQGCDQQYSSSGIGSIPTTCEDSLSCCSMSLSPLSDFCISPTPLVGGDDVGVDEEKGDSHVEMPSSNSHICDLIKRNGAVEQYVAVAAILVELEGEGQLFSLEILQTCVWLLTREGVAKCSERFKQLVVSMKALRNDNLTPHDLWLTAQMGVSLLWHCDSTHQFNEGFSVLYCLHENGIHYVTATPPCAMTPPPTPCYIALKAVKLCIKSNNMSGAITVLEACNYAQGNTEKEKLDRGEVLLTLAQKCVSDPAHLTSAYKCIEAVLSSPPGRHINTHLSQCVSDVLKETMATPTQTTPTHVQITPTLISSLSIVKRMVNRNIPLDHNMCTLLVKQLLLSDRKDDALELVEGAVELGWYQCGETTPYSLMLPPTLTRLEIELIIRRHVTVLPRPPSHPLEITFPFDLRDNVESALETVFTPPLIVSGRDICHASSTVCIIVSLASLRAWTKAVKDNKKDFKRKICTAIIEEVKPFYQAKKFQSSGDYRHLITILQKHFGMGGANTLWEVSPRMQADIRTTVSRIMESCDHTYNKEYDISQHLISNQQ